MIDLDSTPARYRGTIEVYTGVCVCGCNEPEWRWRCKSNNHTILGHGEGYRRKAGALNAIDAQYSVVLSEAGMYTGHRLLPLVVPWMLVIVDRHHDTTTGAVY
ncbi:YegP family protein [Gordonia sp. UCD-TK1]|uniref:YegP family protein n=1 Tax=Gordonia sp. UCD-TK1 TaxID=1857893 RepID=UPI00080DD42A|nr:YegP family protein [Gordonia sp. UCD-TK1]OCH80339.1 hypothetical protein A9310_21605 [Gordonia sp. UCD-TK1]